MSEMKNTSTTREQVEQDIAEFARTKGYSPDQIVQLLRPTTPAPAGMSIDIDQLAAAIAQAKGKMFSPGRNKHVSVKRKKGGTYEFRYASLDVINDMLRLPLFESGLSILHIMRPNSKGALFMATRLLHKSGQYMDSVLPIIQSTGDAQFFADDDVISGPQKLGSLITFAKRYNICALLDIAAQEDDDANVAEGNMVIDHEYPVEPDAQLRVLQDRYSRLISAAANARDPAGIGEVLQRWQKGMEFWHRMRLEGDMENWDRLMNLIPAALERVHGKVIAAAFHGAATATRKSQIDHVRAIWDNPDGQAERAAMKALNEISYGMLFEHLRMQVARVEREEEEAEARLAEQAAKAALMDSVREEGSPFDGARLSGPAAIEADLSFRHVRDEFGEIVTDVLTRETDWAKAYVEEWLHAENRTALREHNEEGLAWVERVTEARVILMQGLGKDRFAQAEESQAPSPAPVEPDTVDISASRMEEAALFVETAIAEKVARMEPTIQDDARQLPLLPDVAFVTLHMTARGTPDLSRYLRAVKISLDQVAGPELRRWEELNLPTADGLPRGTQLEVMGVLARRKQTLGVAA